MVRMIKLEVLFHSPHYPGLIPMLYLLLASIWIKIILIRLFTKPITLIVEMKVFIKNTSKYGFSKASWNLFQTQVQPNYPNKVNLYLGRASPPRFYRFATLFKEFHQENRQTLPRKPSCLIMRNEALGDVLLVTPIIKALYEQRNGNIDIHVATHYVDLFRDNPYVTQVIHKNDLAKQVRDYDIVFNLNGVYEGNPQQHILQSYANCILGSSEFDAQPKLYPNATEIYKVQEVLKNFDRPFIVAHKPNHPWPNRQISEKIWQEMILAIQQQSQFDVIQIGSSSDFAFQNQDRFHDHRARYSVQELSLLIAASKGFIGIDSGPSHVATCSDVPMAVFFTCAHHEYRKPLRKNGKFLPLIPSVDCYGCLTKNTMQRTNYYCERGDNACTYSFNANDLANQVIQLFQSESIR